MDTKVAYTGIILFAALAGLLSLILWKNAAAPDALEKVGIALGATLPVVIAVLGYVKAESMSDSFVYALFFDQDKKTITSGNPMSAYASLYFPIFLEIPAESVRAPNIDAALGNGLDLVEGGIVKALHSHCYGHWQFSVQELLAAGGRHI